ncbi:NAD(P)/FAD-dependent oxidoreductase [Tengunoibacter tsumagoiensis]|uniref:Oxidoreductase n=1 Tax=Tengunoibacter tsumagoiensis TaxID=2014871 RepID=A0A401ZVB4_9CHLR|nr:NAD(P)/FAD-dependent oxidoreductase [Tengunoibacter tsumagoiensis]GCE10680.1 oxidoreductase [Tengunoibacter tsumagoiensis]
MEYAVLGGGALGLMTAYRLAQAGQSVMVFEREELAGGLASGFRVGDNWLEKFYHHIFRTDKTVIKTIEELDLGERLEWQAPRTVSFVRGEIHQLDSPLSLLRFSPLRFDERLRVGMVLAYLKIANPAWMEGKTADAWLNTWMGSKAYPMIFQSLFKGKFGKLYDQIALPWFWARIHDRTTQLGYLRGGFQLIYERLVERTSKLGGKILLGTTVENVLQGEDGRWIVKTNRGEWTFDRVISTFPTRLSCRLIEGLPESYKQQYDWGQAYGAHCLILALDRPLTDSYWINMCDGGYPFTGLFEHTNFRPTSEYGGRHIVYLGNYRSMDDPLFQQSKEKLIAEFTPHLKRINPDFDPAWIHESWIFQAPYAQPIVTTDYRQHIPPLETPLTGLWMANMFQIYPHDRGQNYSLELANQLAERLLS